MIPPSVLAWVRKAESDLKVARDELATLEPAMPRRRASKGAETPNAKARRAQRAQRSFYCLCLLCLFVAIPPCALCGKKSPSARRQSGSALHLSLRAAR